MDKNYRNLEKASGLLFSIGAVFSKLQYLPYSMVRVGSNISALLMYLVGYFLWLAACRQYPNQKDIKRRWYSFVEFKAQFTASAIIGSIAMAFSLLAIFHPAAFVVSAWLMVTSNFLWVLGERNKIENPPPYLHSFDTGLQKIYFNYTTIAFSISFITALSVTSVVCLPNAAIYVVSLATIITTGLTLWSFEHLLEFWFPVKKILPVDNASDTPEISPCLALISASQPTRTSEYNPEPLSQSEPVPPSTHSNSIFTRPGGGVQPPSCAPTIPIPILPGECTIC